MGETTPVATKLAEAKAIVRALAATPVIQSEPDGYRWCVLCDAGADDGAEVVHQPGCVWRNASKWVESDA